MERSIVLCEPSGVVVMGFHHLGHSEPAVVFAEARGDAGSDGPERGFRADERGRLRCRPRRKLVKGGALWCFVWRPLVKFRWPPEQIAATLRAMHPDVRQARVSHETIYAQPRGGLKAAMVEALRQAKHPRGVGRRIGRKPGGGSAIVPESLKIIHRPEKIDARLIPGHWAGDRIKGASNRSSVGTRVERKTRFVTLARMEGNGAAADVEGFTRQMKTCPPFCDRA